MASETTIQAWGRLASQVRAEFDQGVVDRQTLERLYREYQSIPDLPDFVREAAHSFPSFNCGLASLYLQYRLGLGQVVRGRYDGHDHTFLLVAGLVMDITADQYGGPPVYVGELCYPWSLKPIRV